MTTLRQLRFLVALSETLNFSRAAEVCHVTQSTLSTGLKDLEHALGAQLAERSRHSVVLTPVGLEVARRARSVLADVADIEDFARSAGAFGAGSVRFGAIPTVGPFIMPRALPLIRSAFPALRLYLREELTASLVDGLVAGRLDVAIIALPHDLPAEIAVEPLFRDGYQLTVPRGHPLANRDSVDGHDLEGRDLLLLERGHCLQRHALSSFPDLALTRDETFAATSLPTLVAMVEQGLGLTLLPNVAVAAGVAKGHDVALTDLAGAQPREVVLAYRTTSAQIPLFHELGRLITRAHTLLTMEGESLVPPRRTRRAEEAAPPGRDGQDEATAPPARARTAP
ncbi:LysR family transcriptional regulator [Acuticoccus sediminis]|uniref:LysR family transcriptional regulator n=1 Tax=Acuticoccus sediminis TaxID=2184697 RepID=A0A8B2P4B4_9HYPH|nr:hydrogen peroxide-inducible genes activator [Acuticoccus sediminis]RAI03962.1 LysR family transcriptional regulator [Acuticoccus sediminis]